MKMVSIYFCLISLSVSAGFVATDISCANDIKVLNKCITEPYTGQLVENCLLQEFPPMIPDDCNRTSYELYVPSCVCPWYRSNFPCAQQYCPPFNRLCLAHLLNYTTLCGMEIPDPYVTNGAFQTNIHSTFYLYIWILFIGFIFWINKISIVNRLNAYVFRYVDFLQTFVFTG
jgi:hypothetical protein